MTEEADSGGYATVVLPGINSGYLVLRDPQGNRTGRSRASLPQVYERIGGR